MCCYQSPLEVWQNRVAVDEYQNVRSFAASPLAVVDDHGPRCVCFLVLLNVVQFWAEEDIPQQEDWMEGPRGRRNPALDLGPGFPGLPCASAVLSRSAQAGHLWLSSVSGIGPVPKGRDAAGWDCVLSEIFALAGTAPAEPIRGYQYWGECHPVRRLAGKPTQQVLPSLNQGQLNPFGHPKKTGEMTTESLWQR